jgi:hypothetical protein
VNKKQRKIGTTVCLHNFIVLRLGVFAFGWGKRTGEKPGVFAFGKKRTGEKPGVFAFGKKRAERKEGVFAFGKKRAGRKPGVFAFGWGERQDVNLVCLPWWWSRCVCCFIFEG